MQQFNFLSKLMDFEPAGFPFLSVYLNTEPNETGKRDFEVFLRKQLKDHGAVLTMNLVTYWALQEEGRDFGLSQENWTKVASVLDQAHDALGRAHAAGLNPAYGTDLLGGMHRHQAKELAIRARTLPVIDVIRGATTVAAALLQREGRLGVIAPRAAGDLVVTDADPVADISVLAESRLAAVVQDGHLVVDELGPGHLAASR